MGERCRHFTVQSTVTQQQLTNDQDHNNNSSHFDMVCNI